MQDKVTGQKNKENSHFRVVTGDENGLRLDRWFKRHFPGLSHGQLQKWLRKGLIRVEGKRADSSDRLATGARLRLPPGLVGDNEKTKKPASGSRPVRDTKGLLQSVLYEDDDVVVLNKPAGLAVQGGTGVKENLDDSLMLFSLDGTAKPKLVHRLDKDTSGVLVLARSAFAAATLSKAFRQRTTIKIYWAVTLGVPTPARGKITAALAKEGQHIRIAENDTEAQAAQSLYVVVEKAAAKAAFVALQPLSGRTHQLRVHMAHIGTPLLGDPLYGAEGMEGLPMDSLGKGLHLHARRIMMPHPRGGTLDISAPLSQEMLKTWRWFGFDENADIVPQEHTAKDKKRR